MREEKTNRQKPKIRQETNLDKCKKKTTIEKRTEKNNLTKRENMKVESQKRVKG